MKGAIASVEIFAFETPSRPRRLTLTITAPERAESASGWLCRVSLADLRRPRTVTAPDSVTALAGALAVARGWLGELTAQGVALTRDRTGETVFELE